MPNKFFKIGKDQESNLKWLLNRIFYNAQCGRKSYIVTSSVLNYADIFEAYEQYYHRTCPASIFSDKVELGADDILCVHDLLGNFHFNILDVIKENENKCKYVYVTLLGHEADYNEFDDSVKQLTISFPKIEPSAADVIGAWADFVKDRPTDPRNIGLKSMEIGK